MSSPRAKRSSSSRALAVQLAAELLAWQLEHTLQALKSEHMKLAMRQEPGPLGSSSMRKASQAASHGRWERCRSFETLKTSLAPGRHIWKEGHGPIIL